ncbi:MAG: class IV adenylate cyclase [Treponema sp.]
MYEIEQKAHVSNRKQVIEALNTFAEYDGKADKRDIYYHLPLTGHTSSDNTGYVSCRIRYEKHETGNAVQNNIFFTYKRKEQRTGTGKVPIEVNDEKECILSDSSALEALLTDAGFTVARTKHKITEGWYASTEAGKAHIELCTVPPLGDFLEIEIMSKTENEKSVTSAGKCIEELFSRCSIPRSAVESRYYNEMLAAPGT